MSAKKISKLIPEQMHIRHFQIIKGQIEGPFEFDMNAITDHSFTVDLDMTFSLEANLVKSDFKINVETKSENEKEATGSFEFVFLFEVENLDELAISGEENDLEIDSGLSNAIASISYSTSRGILMTRFNGTALENFILPIIDPNELVKF